MLESDYKLALSKLHASDVGKLGTLQISLTTKLSTPHSKTHNNALRSMYIQFVHGYRTPKRYRTPNSTLQLQTPHSMATVGRFLLPPIVVF